MYRIYGRFLWHTCLYSKTVNTIIIKSKATLLYFGATHNNKLEMPDHILVHLHLYKKEDDPAVV